MKKYLIPILSICFLNSSFAQEIKVDAIAGFNASQLDGDRMAGFNKLGLLLGGSAGVNLKENFKVELRILYSQKGSRFTDKDPVDLNFRLNYLDFPMVFRYRLDQKFFELAENIELEAGLQFSYLLEAKEGDPLIGFVRLYDAFEPRIYGFILGCSYNYDRYTFRLNFQRSLVSTNKSLSFLDRTLSFTLAYSLAKD
ncbi:outer membrane beta-barrel protein [Hyphobacterium sp. CCMP332]|nr:outer membrane beta-barrel protein [Hyphobacterium sp. CCMP332]